jgi:hypothetical protein
MVADARLQRYVLLRSALSGLWLVIALPLGIACVVLVGMLTGTEPGLEMPKFLIPFLIPFLLAGGLWARSLGRIGGYPLRSFFIAGAIGVTVSTFVAIQALSAVENNLEKFQHGGLPIHVIFGIAFTVAALILAGSGGMALGLSLPNIRLAGRLAFGGGIAGALAFLVVAAGLDIIGFRVGAPDAEEQATMIISSVVGFWATAIVGSAVIGQILTRTRVERQ